MTPPPKRPGSMSDDERARVGSARRTPPHGYPIEVDPEVTPPPQPVPPSIEEVARAVDRIALSLHQDRHSGAQLAKVDDKLDRIAVDQAETGALLREFLMPAIKATMGNVDLLLQHHEANKVRQAQFYDREWPAAVKRLDDFGDRISRLESTVHRSTERHEAVVARVEDVERRSHTASSRLTAIETNARVETQVRQALTTKQKVGVGGIAGVIGTLAGLLSKWLG